MDLNSIEQQKLAEHWIPLARPWFISWKVLLSLIDPMAQEAGRPGLG